MVFRSLLLRRTMGGTRYQGSFLFSVLPCDRSLGPPSQTVEAKARFSVRIRACDMLMLTESTAPRAPTPPTAPGPRKELPAGPRALKSESFPRSGPRRAPGRCTANHRGAAAVGVSVRGHRRRVDVAESPPPRQLFDRAALRAPVRGHEAVGWLAPARARIESEE